MDKNDPDYKNAVKLAGEWYSEIAPHIEPILSAIKLGRLLESIKANKS